MTTLNRVAEVWWSTMFHATWQSALLVAGVLIVLRVVRRWPSPVRYGLLLVALAKFLIPPTLALPVGLFSRVAPPVREVAATANTSGSDLGVPEWIDAQPPVDQPHATLELPRQLATGGDRVQPPLVEDSWRPPLSAANESGQMGSSRGELRGPPDRASQSPAIATPAVRRAAGPQRLLWLTGLSTNSCLMLTHLVGTCAALVWTLLRLRQLHRLASAARGVTDERTRKVYARLCGILGLSRRPRLVESDQMAAPISFGAWRPMVMLPAALLTRASDRELQTVLAHELAHHRRYDIWVNWLQNLLCMLFWFNPALWILNGKIRHVREECCDDLLLARGLTQADSYCDTLLNLARQAAQLEPCAVTLGMAHHRHPLGGRITRIMDRRLPRPGGLSVLGFLSLLVFAAVVLPGVREATLAANSDDPIREAPSSGDEQLADAPQPQDPPGDAIIISGQVVDANGRPLPQANVYYPVNYTVHENEAIRVESTSDAKGRFSLQVDKSLVPEDSARRPRTVWAVADGHGLGSAQMDKGVLSAPSHALTIALPAQSDTSFIVLGADGRPLAKARVSAWHFRTAVGYEIVPRKLARQIGAVTGDDGLAKLPAIPRAGFLRVHVDAEGYGRQQFRLGARDEDPARRTLRLKAAGQITGRLTGPDEAPRSKVTVHFSSERFDQSSGGTTSAVGTATVKTDVDGRFKVPAFAEGKSTVNILLPTDQPYRARVPEEITILSGQMNTVDIPVMRGVELKGRIQVSGSGQPVSGAKISVSFGWRQSEHTLSDAAGRFTAYGLPGRGRLQVIALPAEYVEVERTVLHGIRVPEGVAEFELPPIEVEPSTTVEGRLVNEQAEPFTAEKAQVIAVAGNRRYGWGKVTEQGTFTLRRMPQEESFEYQLWIGDHSGPIKLLVTREKPLVLRVPPLTEPADGVIIQGHVRDQQGRPVVGASVQIRYTERDASDQPVRSGTVQFGPTFVLQTDQQGAYRSPSKAAISESGNKIEFRAIVSGGETLPAAGVSLAPQPRKTLILPDVIATRLRTVSGQVVDEDGKPVAGARILNWGNPAPRTQAVSASDGRFELSGISREDSTLFIDDANRPLTAYRIAASADYLPIRLGQQDPAPDPPLPRDQRVGLSRQVLQPIAEKVLAGGDKQAQGRVLEVMALWDPGQSFTSATAANDVQADDPQQQLWARDSVRRSLFYYYLDQSDQQRALQLARAIENRFWRMQLLTEAAPRIAPDLPGQRRLLTELLQDARRETDDAYRIRYFSRIARRLLDLGERDAARPLVEQTVAWAGDDAAGNPPGAEANQVLGNHVRLDAPAVLKRIEASRAGRNKADALALVAQELAADNPTLAEELFRKNNSYFSPEYFVGMCRRMAPRDLPRAERLANTQDQCQKAYALAVMADAVAATDTAAARRLMAESLLAFDATYQSHLVGLFSSRDAAVFAASLLPTVEKIDRSLIDAHVNHCLALRWYPRHERDLTSTIPDTSQNTQMENDAVLATLIAPYRLGAARRLVAPLTSHFEQRGWQTSHVYLNRSAIVRAIAVVDPASAVRLIQELPDEQDSRGRSVRDAMRLVAAKALVMDPGQIHRELLKYSPLTLLARDRL